MHEVEVRMRAGAGHVAVDALSARILNAVVVDRGLAQQDAGEPFGEQLLSDAVGAGKDQAVG